MQKILVELIELQELDSRLDELISRLGDLPETVKTLEIQIDNEKEQNEVRQQSIEENEAIVRKRSADIEDQNVKIKKYKDQLFIVTTNREYDALNSQIEYGENEVKESENAIVLAEEEMERLGKALKDAVSNIETMLKNLDDAKKSLEVTEKEIEVEKVQLEEKRKGIISQIPRNFLSTYTRVRKARNGLAVVPMQRDACSGCHNRLIPQKRVDIYKRTSVITCDFCGRFIYATSSTPQDEEE